MRQVYAIIVSKCIVVSREKKRVDLKLAKVRNNEHKIIEVH